MEPLLFFNFFFLIGIFCLLFLNKGREFGALMLSCMRQFWVGGRGVWAGGYGTCNSPLCSRCCHLCWSRSVQTPSLIYIHSTSGSACATACPLPGGSTDPRFSPHNQHTRQPCHCWWRASSGKKGAQRQSVKHSIHIFLIIEFATTIKKKKKKQNKQQSNCKKINKNTCHKS